ncbi:ester cyclase [Chitinimonas sp.]|uniref:ester cyclase n=1 Tax=Chitinimonas sp. TaxID=1934313 RepID=UPI0035B199B8
MKYLVSAPILSLALLAAGMPAAAQSTADINLMKRQLAEIKKTKEGEKANLENFDDLDFNVYSGQKWDQLYKSHSKDIIVHYPDESVTKGMDAHIEKLKPMFIFAPDHKISEHPIRIGSGDWTAVQGIVEGTFSKPMPIGDGKTIPPTGKKFKLTMVTIGHWKNGVMDEEWLMWDNQSFMKQIGLAP